ncbi:transcription factor IIIB 90 kDa subunit, putative [Rhizoctonia solani AG-3 Rhs1AP]|uniref:B-related factor 1 n=1 Tax=Rhizoctonia solani AG-3 Rhs1AP TaxID=1086054 RepID=X8JKN4_9AGAM|nr:transcription factor IIIB 90 kDa subunit, putative [Rhizoctonia solani AG-3 Rhs1AP]
MAKLCPECGGGVIEYNEAAGNGFCNQCGTLVEENRIVAEVTFGESASGAAIAHGSFVALGQTRAHTSGAFGHGSSEPGEQSAAHGRMLIRQQSSALHLGEHIVEKAQRYYNLAISHRFIKGRRSEYVAAVCLYIACRTSGTRHMLIDFSDMLRVNVFVLGAYYLKLVRELKINLPLIDPAHLIARFAALLEFGEETNKVVIDATRLVTRFSRDWMTHGRRPAGICGACLLLAARMNNFRRSIQEIVQVVKIGDETVKKRLEEFKLTPSAALTMHDFRNVMLEEAADPPSFTKGLEKQKQEGKEGKGKSISAPSSRKRKRVQVDDTQDDTEETSVPTAPAIDMTQGIVALGLDNPPNDKANKPLFYPSDEEERDAFEEIVNQGEVEGGDGEQDLDKDEGRGDKTDDPFGEDIAAEVSHYLNDPEGSRLTAVLQDTEQQQAARVAHAEQSDDLDDLDEEELDEFILTEEEAQKKTRMWVEFNRDYLEKIAMKGLDAEEGTENKRQKSRKTRKRQKPRDSTTASGETPAQAARALMQKKKTFSRRINYAAVEKLFEKPNESNKSKNKSRVQEHVEEQDDKDDDNEKYDDDKEDGGAMEYYDEGYQEEV